MGLRFLHTADLHLGKSFHDHSLIEDQRHILGELSCLVRDSSFQGLIISGDVFDRSIPSPEAVELFSSFLGNLKRDCPSLSVLIIPGNHDSPLRLAYGRQLFAGLGIFIAEKPSFEPVLIRAGKECCACFLLPFLYPGCLTVSAEETAAVLETAAVPENGEALLRTQAGLAAAAAGLLEKARQKALEAGADYTLLAAHLFCSGGKKSDSERTFIGQAEEIDPLLFSGFDYLALGHLHRFQSPAPNAWYSGSPLAYSFDEAGEEKVFLSVTLNKENETSKRYSCCQVEAKAVSPLHPLRRLSGTFDHFLKDDDPLLKEAADSYLEISLEGKELAENPMPLLRPRFPLLMHVRQDEAQKVLSARDTPAGDAPASLADRPEPGNRGAVTDDFREFLTGLYGQADEEKLVSFAEILENLPEDAGEADETA